MERLGGLSRVEVIGSNHEVCVISDRHAAIMNKVHNQIPVYQWLNHCWLMRHFAANFYLVGASKSKMEDLRRLCMENEPKIFHEKYDALKKLPAQQAHQWLESTLPIKELWAHAFNPNGHRYWLLGDRAAWHASFQLRCTYRSY